MKAPLQVMVMDTPLSSLEARQPRGSSYHPSDGDPLPTVKAPRVQSILFLHNHSLLSAYLLHRRVMPARCVYVQ